MNKKKIVVIGGGTGTIPVLNGLKKFNNLDLKVVVSMTDDGGSNAVVRDEFGILPLSDLRKSIITLSSGGNALLRKLFNYRFDKGNGLSGHTLGNLMMMAVTDIEGSELGAISAISKLFNLKGEVIPVTLDDTRLVAHYDNGEILTGEHIIDEPEQKFASARIQKLSLSSHASAFSGAVEAIQNADFIVIGPGDLYTSTLANIIVPGVSEALATSSAKIIFINNLMSKSGQTMGFTAIDMVQELEKYMKRTPHVVVQHSGKFQASVTDKYRERGEAPIEDNLTDTDKYIIVRADVANNAEVEEQKGDTLVRSLIRHDSEKLAQVLYKIFQS